MAIPLYLAMTAAEFRSQSEYSAPIAWMACHFSPYGTGLTNLPKTLPDGSMLILNDRTPICGHDPDLICTLLSQTVTRTKACAVLLDLQRPDVEEVKILVRQLINGLPCPVAVSHHYAAGLDCPIFLPPVPVTVSLADFTAPWQGREIWLEAALDCIAADVDKNGCSFPPFPGCGGEFPHADTELHCHYRIETEENRIRFILRRTEEDLQALLEKAEGFGISCAVGLYQELHK